MSDDLTKKAALAQALDLVKENPASADNWNSAAIAALQLADMAAAVEYIGQAIALEPDDAHNYSNRGRILFALGREEEALGDYNQAIENSPTPDPALFASRSVINLATGREAAALSDLNSALELAPTAENYFNRAAFFANRSLAGEALRDITRVIELKPDDPDHRLTRANLAFAIGLNELGLQDIEAAQRLDTTGALQVGLIQLAGQLELHLKDSPQPEVARQLIQLIRGKEAG